jgi:uncharacterized protein YndB with AHSA1/START domain
MPPIRCPDPTQESRVRLTAEIRYAADPLTVFGMLTDEAFQKRKLAQTGALTFDVSVSSRPDGGAVVTSTRAVPTDQVPEAFRALVGDRLTIEQTETWGPPGAGGVRTGTLEVSVPGTPVTMSASLSLSEDGVGPVARGSSPTAAAGCVERVDGELKARVPLIGGRIEKATEPAVRAAIEAEERIGQAWLTGT